MFCSEQKNRTQGDESLCRVKEILPLNILTNFSHIPYSTKNGTPCASPVIMILLFLRPSVVLREERRRGGDYRRFMAASYNTEQNREGETEKGALCGWRMTLDGSHGSALIAAISVARWQNWIPSWGHNPMKRGDQVLQPSVAEP